jgi:hypothetical protein
VNGRILRIPTGLLVALLKRGVAIWIASRLIAMSVFSMAAAAGGHDFSPMGLVINIWTVVMSTSLVLLDVHRRKELMLLNNLGIRLFVVALVGTIPAAIGESLLVMLAS